jgi:transcription elongation factor Elf1
METGVNARVSEVLPTIKETNAPHIGHSNHLCDMVEKGQVSLQQIKSLIKDPKFICKKCGRVANNSDNLCEPVDLYPQVEAATVAPLVETPAASAVEETPAAPIVEETLVEEVEEEDEQPGP